MFTGIQKFWLSTGMGILAAAWMGYWGIHRISKTTPLKHQAEIGTVVLTSILKGPKGRPIPGAKISVYLPEHLDLCTTNDQGTCTAEFSSPQGRTIIVAASGLQFQATKKLLVPRLSPYKTEILFEPSQTESGHMLLLSKSLDEVNGRILNAISRSKALDDLVIISPEKQLAEHRLPAIRDQLLSLLRQDIKWLSQDKGFSQNYTLRGLWNGRPYVELTLRDGKGRLKGGFLFKAGTTDERFLTQMMERMSLSVPFQFGPMPVPHITIKTSQPTRVRTYINGILVPGITQVGKAQFWAPGTMGHLRPEETLAVAVTADNGPLLRGTVTAQELGKGIEWTYQTPTLSQRSD